MTDAEILTIAEKADLTDKEIRIISRFIRENYKDMYKTWKEFGGKDFYRN